MSTEHTTPNVEQFPECNGELAKLAFQFTRISKGPGKNDWSVWLVVEGLMLSICGVTRIGCTAEELESAKASLGQDSKIHAEWACLMIAKSIDRILRIEGQAALSRGHSLGERKK